MSSEIALKETSLEIHQLLIESQECLKIVHYLLRFDPEADVYSKGNNTFWRMTASIYIDYAILKLTIIFDLKAHYGIAKLLDNLEKGRKFEGHVPDNKPQIWRDRLVELEETCTNLKFHRDKRIAHKDKNFQHTPLTGITMGKFKRLIGTVQTILAEIHWIVWGEHLEFDIVTGSPEKELKKIIRDLDQFRREELKPLFDEARKNGLTGELPKSER